MIVRVIDWESRFRFPITLVSQCLSVLFILFIHEGPEKATRGGVNGSQSKFHAGTRHIS
jgi:hypothetical protein